MNTPTLSASRHLIGVSTPDVLAYFRRTEGILALDPAAFAADAPDIHLMLVDGDRLDARCSLWWMDVPVLPGHRLGLVGHYAAADEAAGLALLAAATEQLRTHHCTLAVGPIDGATWRPYRFATETGTHPPFFMEPHHPPAYPHHFERAGFGILARYRSALVPAFERAAAPAPVPGVATRPLDASDFETELLQLYELASTSFRDNFLYTPIPRDAFTAQFRALRPLLRPELVRIAEHDGRHVGFCFALPDHEQARRGEAVDTVVVKTLAVHPQARGQGLGGRLVAETHRAARDLGFRRAIHALMHEDNASNRISNRHGKTMRRYALFAKPLNAATDNGNQNSRWTVA